MTSAVISKPLAIGAIDLMRAVQCNYSGTLHTRVKKFLGKKKWQPRYVVISQGCLYIYEDKNAKHVDCSYTIKKFQSVIELEEDGEESFCFCVKYEIPTRKPLVFACDTDLTRKVWVEKFESVILDVQNFSADSGFGSSAGSISTKEIGRLRMQYLKLDTEEKGYEEIEDLLMNSTESHPVQVSNDVAEASYATSNVLLPHNWMATTNKCDELLYENIVSNTSQTGNSLSNSASLLSVRGGSEHSDTYLYMSTSASLLSVRGGSEHSDMYHMLLDVDGASKSIPSIDYLSDPNGKEDIYANTEKNQHDETVPKTVRATAAASEISTHNPPVSSLQVSVTNRLGISGDEESDNNSCSSDHTFESPVEDIDIIYANTKLSDEADYFCDTIKKTKRIMQLKPQGTFLICPGEATRLDLCVKTSNINRWFHIHEQNNKQFSLYKDLSRPQVVFPTLDALLCYYHFHDLPSQHFKVKLTGMFPGRRIIVPHISGERE